MSMPIEILLVVFVFGLVFGSFFNVVAIRTMKKESLQFPPSHCVNCNHSLGALDLIPVFSWLFLKGKCRYCKEKISPIYPVVELFTAISYTIVVYKFGFTIETLINLVLITVLMVATSADLKEKWIPDRFVVVGLILVLILNAIEGDNFVYVLYSAVIAFGTLVILSILSGGQMGGADITLYALIGLSIGWQDSLASLFYAAFAASIGYLVYILTLKIRKKKVPSRIEIPFVPFIAMGVLASYFLPYFDFLK